MEVEFKSRFCLATFSEPRKWWLGQVSSLFLLALSTLFLRYFPCSWPEARRGEKIQQEFGPWKPVFLSAWRFCTQQILSVCVEVRAGSSRGVNNEPGFRVCRLFPDTCVTVINPRGHRNLQRFDKRSRSLEVCVLRSTPPLLFPLLPRKTLEVSGGKLWKGCARN